MPRPSRNIDRRLLDAGRALVPETGVSGLKVRDVARKARVNLGMFHYHFRSREAFVRRLLQELYEDFFARLNLETAGEGPARERLRRALVSVGRFARDNRRLFMMLLREALAGERGVLDIARRNFPRHVGVLLGLYEECRRAGALRGLPPPVALSFLMGGVSVPNCVVTMLEKAGATRPFDRGMDEVSALFLSDAAIEARVDLLLEALRP